MSAAKTDPVYRNVAVVWKVRVADHAAGSIDTVPEHEKRDIAIEIDVGVRGEAVNTDQVVVRKEGKTSEVVLDGATEASMVEEMLDADIICESNSPYASPILLVKKKTGDKRLCVDYRALNSKTRKEHYPLPLIDDQLDRIARWWIQFQEYDCEIEYRPGARMAHVDALSRGPVTESATESDTHVLDILNIDVKDWIATVQSDDTEIKRIRDILEDENTKFVADFAVTPELLRDFMLSDTLTAGIQVMRFLREPIEPFLTGVYLGSVRAKDDHKRQRKILYWTKLKKTLQLQCG
ncbi:uncharacterized protein LOC126381333 [Pectinophora gossypiella]|uniref:uncharacterized protein LOC126381333 n=1 Tax=Pectinophora gossypiella TaxID=13191 RepID=UPI00214E8021|nr:uncharacterized protein LOC126381333 [Pectinophora gossypiella]